MLQNATIRLGSAMVALLVGDGTRNPATLELGHQLIRIGVMKTYKQLNEKERFTIEILYQNTRPIREIACFLGRSPNTISREIQKNQIKGTYTAEKANQKVSARR